MPHHAHDHAGETGSFSGVSPAELRDLTTDSYSTFHERLVAAGFKVTRADAELLRARTGGSIQLASVILAVTGVHGIRELLNSQVVRTTLAREVNPLLDQPDWVHLRGAAHCASVLHTVTPASLRAALAAYRTLTGDDRPQPLEAEQLIIDMAQKGLLVPRHQAEGEIAANESFSSGWRMPWAVAQGVLESLPESLKGRVLAAGVLKNLRVEDTDQLFGEQLIQARRAGQWSLLAELLSNRYGDVLAYFTPHARIALRALPRQADQVSPVLLFLRLHLEHLPSRLAPISVSATPASATDADAVPGMAAARVDIAAAARPLRTDFADAMTSPNQIAITAAYVTSTLLGAGRFADAVRLGERVEQRIEQLTENGHALSQQAEAAFRYYCGVAYAGHAELTAAATQFEQISPSDCPARSRVPLTFLAEDYEDLIWAILSGHSSESRTGKRQTAAASYREALSHLDTLDIAAAGSVIIRDSHRVARADLWPLLTLVEHWWMLLRGDVGRWNQRLDGLFRKRARQLRENSLGQRIYQRVCSEMLMSSGHLQRVAPLLKDEDAEKAGLQVPLARMFLITGQPSRTVQLAEQYAFEREIPFRDRAELKVMKAVALLAMEEAVRGEEELNAAADLCGSVGSLLPLAFLPGRHREQALRLLESHDMWEQISSQHGVEIAELKRRVRELPGIFPDDAVVVRLTTREREILQKLQGRLSLQEIAEQEHRSLSTVKKQAQAAYRKLRVNSREDAIRRAHELGILLT
ncbi:helix-turn-helix transcriptional regulator [Nesterenkonia rhizosphaerae]|uniref:HTH luxR-type domain-containing protein n=1 Tax=Nesterenkonia rhizosphaerae TaxID=1348272 RepID=A0ABP9FRL4_9MICC